ncbi:Ferri-bacillibactin esterase BesA [compost metagenome]
MKQLVKHKLQILLIVFFVSPALAQTESKPLTIGVTEQFHSAILNETRTINIYLPEDYNVNDITKYPVIYIPDGGMEEDFFHIAGMVRYNAQPWINRFPKSIVIGIENTNRKCDFTFAVPNLDFLEKAGFKKENMPDYGGSENYISFLEKELQPFIEAKYKTNQQKTIIGESLAGLLATEILLKHPNLFDTYIIISPSLWWGDEILLKEAESLRKANLNKQVKVCISAPNKKEDPRMHNEAKTLYKSIKQNQNVISFFDYLPDELHSTVIHQAVYNAFKKMYPKTTYSK